MSDDEGTGIFKELATVIGAFAVMGVVLAFEAFAMAMPVIFCAAVVMAVFRCC